MKVGATFSSIPQTGKLKALMWMATPSSGVRMCWAEKVASLESDLDVAVGEDAGVRELAAGLGGVGEQRAGAALDVDPAVGAGGAGGEALGVELLLVGHQELAERLQHRGALVEGELAQLRADGVAAPGEGGGEVDAGGVDLGDGGAGGGVEERLALAGAADPLAAEVAFEGAGPGGDVDGHGRSPQARPRGASVAWTEAVQSASSASFGRWRRPKRFSVSNRAELMAPKLSATRGLPVGDGGLRLGAASSVAARSARPVMPSSVWRFSRGAMSRNDVGERGVGDAGHLLQRDGGGEALEDVQDDGVGPALDRVVEDGEAHVAAVAGLAEGGVARQAVGPGVVGGVAALVGAEVAHERRGRARRGRPSPA